MILRHSLLFMDKGHYKHKNENVNIINYDILGHELDGKCIYDVHQRETICWLRNSKERC